jgi:hypothetical protein
MKHNIKDWITEVPAVSTYSRLNKDIGAKPFVNVLDSGIFFRGIVFNALLSLMKNLLFKDDLFRIRENFGP